MISFSVFNRDDGSAVPQRWRMAGGVCQGGVWFVLVMGDSAKNKTIRFDSIEFDSMLCQNPPPQSTPGVLDSGSEAAEPVHRSLDRPVRIASELLIACLYRSE